MQNQMVVINGSRKANLESSKRSLINVLVVLLLALAGFAALVKSGIDPHEGIASPVLPAPTLLAKSAEPSKAPAAQVPDMAGMHMAPEAAVESLTAPTLNAKVSVPDSGATVGTQYTDRDGAHTAAEQAAEQSVGANFKE